MNICVYFESSNNQKFITYKKDKIFLHKKIENKNFILPSHINNLFYNYKYPKFEKITLNVSSFSVTMQSVCPDDSFG